MKIRFFGRLGDSVGREVDLDAPSRGCTVAELRELLACRHPHAQAELRSPSLRACIGDMIVGEEALIDPGAEVEFFPPLSGG